MKSLFLIALACPLLFSSCASNSDTSSGSYSQVYVGGNPFYYDAYGSYYQRHWWGGYRPCPKPPGTPDRPIHPPIERPEHPIERPDRPIDRPVTLPAERDFSSFDRGSIQSHDFSSARGRMGGAGRRGRR